MTYIKRLFKFLLIASTLALGISACDIDPANLEDSSANVPTTEQSQHTRAEPEPNKRTQNKYAQNKHTLWKVKGQSNTMYLVGSIHVMKPDAYPLPEPFQLAFNDAEKLVFEIDEEIQDVAKMQFAMLKYAKIAGGKQLKSVIQEKDYLEIRQLAKENNVPMMMIDPFDPWFSSVTLVGLQYLNAGLSPENGIDQHFMRRAQQTHKPIIGLETAEQQFGIFDSVSYNVQVDMLIDTLRESKESMKMMDEMLLSWKTGDMDKLDDLLMEDLKEVPEFYNKFLKQRNENWIPQLLPMLNDSDDYMVVVGAAHMLGDDGVLSLLEKEGYTVEQL